jgi:hypothetical protein
MAEDADIGFGRGFDRARAAGRKIVFGSQDGFRGGRSEKSQNPNPKSQKNPKSQIPKSPRVSKKSWARAAVDAVMPDRGRIYPFTKVK